MRWVRCVRVTARRPRAPVDASAHLDDVKQDVAVMGTWDMDESHAVVGKYGVTSQELVCVYWRQVRERLQLSADITVHGSERTAELGGGYRLALRREPGGFDYTTARGQVKRTGGGEIHGAWGSTRGRR